MKIRKMNFYQKREIELKDYNKNTNQIEKMWLM